MMAPNCIMAPSQHRQSNTDDLSTITALTFIADLRKFSQPGVYLLIFHEQTQPELTNLPAATSNSLRLLMAPKTIPNPRPRILWMQQEEFTKITTAQLRIQSNTSFRHMPRPHTEKNTISLFVKRTISRSPPITCQDKSLEHYSEEITFTYLVPCSHCTSRNKRKGP